MEIVGYLIVGLIVGTAMAYMEGDGPFSTPAFMGLVGLIAWPLVLLLVVVIIPFLPFIWIFIKAGEMRSKRQ